MEAKVDSDIRKAQERAEDSRISWMQLLPEQVNGFPFEGEDAADFKCSVCKDLVHKPINCCACSRITCENCFYLSEDGNNNKIDPKECIDPDCTNTITRMNSGLHKVVLRLLNGAQAKC